MGGNKNVDNDKKAKGLKYDVSEKAKEAGAAVMEVVTDKTAINKLKERRQEVVYERRQAIVTASTARRRKSRLYKDVIAEAAAWCIHSVAT
ncbi:hypothetical protein QE152_g36291 [Popillia japonica]|uniref:Uncharacterized protein n=1 Tax=Popillia japonica TaxID=7064 RepID=A0AAW1ID89_POPJA